MRRLPQLVRSARSIGLDVLDLHGLREHGLAVRHLLSVVDEMPPLGVGLLAPLQLAICAQHLKS